MVDREAKTPPFGVDSRELLAVWIYVKKERQDIETLRLAFFANHWTPAMERLDRTKRAAWFALGLSVSAFTLSVVFGVYVAVVLMVRP